MFRYPGVGAAQLVKLLYNIAHQIHVMAASCPVMADGAGHSLVDGLIDHRDWEHSMFSLINIFVFCDHPVAVESVYDNIFILSLYIIADNRHGITVCFDALIEQLHFRRSHSVGVVCIGLDLLSGIFPTNMTLDFFFLV